MAQFTVTTSFGNKTVTADSAAEAKSLVKGAQQVFASGGAATSAPAVDLINAPVAPPAPVISSEQARAQLEKDQAELSQISQNLPVLANIVTPPPAAPQAPPPPQEGEITTQAGVTLESGKFPDRSPGAHILGFVRIPTAKDPNKVFALGPGGKPVDNEQELVQLTGAKTVEEAFGFVQEVTADQARSVGVTGFEVDELQQFLGEIDQEVEDFKSLLDQRAAQLDDTTKAFVDNIKATLDIRRQQQKEITERRIGGLTVLGIRTGRQRYANEIQTQIIAEEERNGIAKLAELDVQEAQLILEAQTANDDAQFSVLTAKMQAIRDGRKEKRDLIMRMNELELEKQKFEAERLEKLVEDVNDISNREADAIIAAALSQGVTDIPSIFEAINFDESGNRIRNVELGYVVEQVAAVLELEDEADAGLSPSNFISILEKFNNPQDVISFIESKGTGTSKGQNRPQRNNNPLNIKLGGLTEKWVASGEAKIEGTPALDGGNFLVFDDAETGLEAGIDLLNSYLYRDRTIDGAMKLWSGNGYGYDKLAGVAAREGLPFPDRNKTIAQLSKAEMDDLVTTMMIQEGWFAGLDLSLKPGAGDTKLTELAFAQNKEFNDRQAVKDFVDTTRKYETMLSALEEAQTQELRGIDPNLVAVDQALVTLFNKITDPQSVVRESEYARTASDIAFKNSVIGKAQKILTGGAGLTNDEREALVRMAGNFMVVAASKYRDTRIEFAERAERNELNIDDVVGNDLSAFYLDTDFIEQNRNLGGQSVSDEEAERIFNELLNTGLFPETFEDEALGQSVILF